jgi:ferredoxin-type protein NapF
VSACQERVLIVGDGGYPEVDFSRGGCALCGDCADRCREGAFEAGARDPYRAWPHRVSLSDDCMVFKGVECRTCGDVCEQRAIRFQLRVGGAAMPLLDVSACTGCGECLAVCPVRAMQLTVPESNHPGDIG